MIDPKKSVGRKRLMALGDYVEKMAKPSRTNKISTWLKFFKYDSWFGPVLNREMLGPITKDGLQTVIVNHDCGTTGCLLGHVPNVPMFAKLGIVAVLDPKVWGRGKKNKNTIAKDETIFESPRVVWPKGDMPYGRSVVNNHAHTKLAKKLFGIRFERVNQIFMAADYRGNTREFTPQQAVDNLREIVGLIDAGEGWEI